MSSIMISTPPSASTDKFSTGSADSTYSSSPRTDSDSPSPSPTRPTKTRSWQNRRPSLLSSALSKQECTVINIGEPDGPTRLISYLSSGQGFVWNPEIFLPSYLDCDYVPLDARRDPVHDITLSDEEIKNMLPQ
jgi:hypothetical protein